MATDDRPDAFETYAREVLGSPVPDEVVDRCVDLFPWRTVDGELAAIVEEAVSVAAVRDEAPTTVLTFESGGWTIEAQIAAGLLHGRVSKADGTPPPGVTVLVETATSRRSVAADELGGFRADGVRGPLRLTVVAGPGGNVARTDWVTT